KGVTRMEIKVGFEIQYAAVQPTPMVIMLSIHPSRYADIVGTETIVAEPDVPIGFYRDSFGNVCGRLVAPGGGDTPRGAAARGCALRHCATSWCRPRRSFRSTSCRTICGCI